MSDRLGPDFFIVGAPKCGTTSLHAWLEQHPQIYMAPKEQHFFGADLGAFWLQPSAEEYFGSFAPGEAAVRRGEASVWYLLSRRAAREIHTFNPSARIIVMLRNPLEMVPSLHSQLIYDGMEDLADLREALAAEGARRARGITPPHGSDWRLFYREVVSFAEQIQRYIDLFGRQRVHVILFDDLIDDSGTEYRRVLEFLEVDPGFAPVFRPVNSNKRARYRWPRRLREVMLDEHSSIRRLGTKAIHVHAVRSALLRFAVDGLTRINTSVEPRPPIDPELRASLAVELASQIDALAELLDRDLRHWYADSLTPAAQLRASA